jgi:small subunit ribosomal protein S6
MTQLKSLADAPGTNREYETIYILRPNITNDEVAEVNKRVRGIIEGMGGKILKVDNWGKRRLAYEVKKERKGIYLYWQYLAGPGVVDEFERNMRMLDSVIRYMTVKLDADIDPEARPSDVNEETYEKAANTAADEEDMFLRHHDDRSDDDSAMDSDDDRDDDRDDRDDRDDDNNTDATDDTDDDDDDGTDDDDDDDDDMADDTDDEDEE